MNYPKKDNAQTKADEMGDGERWHSTQPYTGTSGFLPSRQGLLMNFTLVVTVLLQVSVQPSRKRLWADWHHCVLPHALLPKPSKLRSTSFPYPEPRVHLLHHQQTGDKSLPAPSHQAPDNSILSQEEKPTIIKK